ncbi:MAG: hypothetical protein NXH75_14900, partial [Halobacteriovoraceae bacterium]|nr:hypothetical protein [Halobacteriovoraceae bacterium]
DKINLKINAGEIYFEILDPRKLFSIDETSQNDSETLYFKFNSLETEVLEGVVIANMGGAHYGLCPNLSAMYAHSISLPLNEHSFRISEWDHLLNWERVGRGKKLKLTEKTKFEFKSEIIKYFN